MEKEYILTIDFGTQSVRAAIFNSVGETLAIEKVKYEPAYFSKEVGYAEQDPNYYFECMAKATNAIAKANPELIKKVKGIATSCFRDTAVLLDKDDKLIRPSILWLDQRQAQAKEKMPWTSSLLFSLVGMKDTIVLNRHRTMAHWIKENEPENWAKVKRYMAISTFFNWKLTGEFKDSPSNQAGHYPFNFPKREWYKSDKALKGQIFGIKKSMLCELVPVGGILGQVTKQASLLTGLPEGLNVFSIGSDKSCETLGVGALHPDIGSVSYGTASTIEITTKKYHESEPFLPGYPACIPGYFNMDVQIYRGYWMINWFMHEFGGAKGKSIDDVVSNQITIEDFNRKMLDVPAGCDGLVLQPYWGPGLRRPLAKGAIIGFSDVHTREHLYRAIIEGIAYALREGLEGFEKKIHHKTKELRVSGGGSQSDAICQITADIFGLPVSRVQTYETSSLGAAIAGFIASGTFVDADDAVNSMVHKSDTFLPNQETHKKYDYLYYKAYSKMYPQLKNIYREIKEYGKKKFNIGIKK